ncbi:MAG: cbb3-type cytochrome oxidase assembly protein CcoS [Saprospiraceae bacterium]|nr:cbb3-type cytochrome oxidase assembly protein CcoS [Saprospiraceae bacterium]MCB0573798.1 cbb3-type cytochrome oxidase assembly protein CcoS [Saprospiraceae bacterium]MCB9306680.1 cbb3-type cytochrome oxidase assembly protein CcoS [Lewinellaceae bacterium]MCB9353027.1 cbb3-type cytochrome oxidase assembly protein CcoS [Lewinellaceae bacterium]
MEIMLLLILFSLLLAAGFLLVYIWAARNGQFDDDYTPSVRMLFDNTVPESDSQTKDDREAAENTEKNNLQSER